jgi:hypothetical protein
VAVTALIVTVAAVSPWIFTLPLSSVVTPDGEVVDLVGSPSVAQADKSSARTRAGVAVIACFIRIPFG